MNLTSILSKLQANPTQTILRTGSAVANENFLHYATVKKLNISVPEIFNGKEIWKKYLSPVLDQGKCGSCWGLRIVLSNLKKYLLK